MSNINFLANLGLTNKDSMSYGDLASARVAIQSIAFCNCGFYSLSGGNTCPHCRKTMFWDQVADSVRATKIKGHQRKTAKSLALDTINNQSVTWKIAGKTNPNLTEVSISSFSEKVKKQWQIKSAHWDWDNFSLKITQLDGQKIEFSAPIGRKYLQNLFLNR
jgi:hypothetical protein